MFDVYCYVCREQSEAVGEWHHLKCPNCGSGRVRRRWTGSPVIVMEGEPNGSTIGVRRKAQDIMRRENEKIRKGAYGKVRKVV